MELRTRGSLVGGVLAALGASACCAGPLILLLLGAGGGWASRLIALEPYSHYLTGLTVLFLCAAFYNLYLRRTGCPPGEACAVSGVVRRQRIVFWCFAVPVVMLISFPLYASLFY